MKKLQKTLAMLLVFSMLTGLLGVCSLAAETAPLLEGGKTAKELGGNRYEVQVQVPGGDADGKYSEIIFMFDSSASNSGKFPGVKQAIEEIGKAVLNDTGTMKLTIMGFGERGVIAGWRNGKSLAKISTPAELEEVMKDFERKDMSDMFGTTNCEAGVTFVQDYIENSPNLVNAYVFYVTDAAATNDEEPRVWDEWENEPLMRYIYGSENTGYKLAEDGVTVVPDPSVHATVTEHIQETMYSEVAGFLQFGEMAPATAVSFPELQAFADAAAAAEKALEELQAEIAEATADQTEIIETAQALKDEAAEAVAEAEADLREAEADLERASEEELADAQAAVAEAKDALETAEADQDEVDAEQDLVIDDAQDSIDVIMSAVSEEEGAKSLADRLAEAEKAVEDTKAAATDRAAITETMLELMAEVVYEEDGVTPKTTVEDNVTVPLTRGRAWMDLAWEQAYEAAGLTLGEAYPNSVVANAFADYEYSDGTGNIVPWIDVVWLLSTCGYRIYCNDFYADHNGKGGTYRSYHKGERAAIAATELAAMDKVEMLYMIGEGSGANASWMNASEENKAANVAAAYVEGDNVRYQNGTDMTAVCEVLKECAAELARTPYNDVSVTDYMSKWVDLDPTTVKVVDGKGNTVAAYDETLTDENGLVTGYTYKWTGEALCAEKAPIVLEMVDRADYEAGGKNVVGNDSGTIYKLTWNIKDGALLRSDIYSLVYEVSVDTFETGFAYGKDYPANGNTDVHYTDDDGEPQTNDIEVPEVEAVTPESLASKTKEKLEDEKYQVDIRVPGESDDRHDEVILMVDGSYSGDDEWESMKSAIVEIGETVLNGSGSTVLTLMAFGMGDNEVLVHVKNAADLEAALGELPGTLLYGRSSTNCESGFTGVAEYIENHDETLADVHVLYISDGEVNTDETPANFYDWKNNGWHRFSEEVIISVNFEAECGAILEGSDRSEAFVKFFGADTDVETVYSTATYEMMDAYNAQIWADVYAYAGLDPETLYPVSDVERAFVKYDKDHNTYVQDNFYYALVGRGYPNRTARTVDAAEELAKMDAVASMYIIDSNRTTDWMKNVDDTVFIPAGSIANLISALEEVGVLADLSKTPYRNVVITDYMSKWVDLDPASVKIYNENSGELIWTVADGWLTDDIPTEAEPPVEVELVEAKDYPAGGGAVVGNTSGDIYKLTWKVKDGPLYRSDNYRLSYEVTVDTAEEGFQFDKDYPANGTTTEEYDGLEEPQPIVVPTLLEEPEETPKPPRRDSPREDPPEEVIEEEDVPLADLPEEEPEEIVEDLPEEEVPLADIPQTGDASVLYLALMGLSGTGLAGLALGKKREDEE